MKYILIFLLAFTVSASIAQTKTFNVKHADIVNVGTNDSALVSRPKVKGKQSKANIKAVAAKDTVYTFKLNASQTGALMGALETTYSLLPRSNDLTALQANEAQKQIAALAKVLAEQLPKPKSDSLAVNVKK